VERFSTMVRGSPKRRVDLELRTLDVLLAGFFLIVLSPLIGLIALVLVLTSGRPLLYRGERVGRDGRIFHMLKFRTLRRAAEERLGPYLGEELMLRTREETTGLGRRLRAAQLDELPQLWNVLRGDMSLVGPRPIRPRFFEELANDRTSATRCLMRVAFRQGTRKETARNRPPTQSTRAATCPPFHSEVLTSFGPSRGSVAASACTWIVVPA